MKILNVNQYINLKGGAEVSTYQLLQGLVKKKEIEKIYWVGVKNKDIANSFLNIDDDKIETIQIDSLFTRLIQLSPIKLVTQLVFSWYLSRKIKKYIKEVDLILVQDDISAFASSLIPDKHIPRIGVLRDYWPVCPLGVRFIDGKICNDSCRFGTYDCFRKRKNFFYPLLHLYLSCKKKYFHKAYSSLNQIVCVSEYVKKINFNRGTVIYNSLNKIRTKPNMSLHHPIKLIYAGRLEQYKGVEYLLHSVKRLKKRFPTIKLFIYGSGSNFEDLLKLQKRLNLNENVRFCQSIQPEKLYKEIAESDILICPSVWDEPISRVIPEAIAQGTPVVAFDVGGISEILINNTGGLLAKSRDVNDLTKKIEMLLDNKELRITLIRNGQKRIKNMFDLKTNVDAYFKVFRMSIKKK
jgi:glycosyltransferase involved in cell wall biosynthesis